METVTVRTVLREKEQPNPVKIKVEKNTKLSDFRKHLKAKGLKGILYIDGNCKERCNGNTILQLNSGSCVQLRQTRRPPRAPLSHPVYVDSELAEQPMMFMCHHDTTVEELKFLIQDQLGIPASELSFKKKGKDPCKEKAVECSSKNKPVVVIPSLKSIFTTVPDEHMTQSGLLWVSKEMREWKDLAKRGLGLSDADIHAIESDNKNNIEEQRYKALWQWHRQKGNCATWRALVSACCQAKDQALARQTVEVYMQEKWKSPVGTPSPQNQPTDSVDDMSARVINIGRLQHSPK